MRKAGATAGPAFSDALHFELSHDTVLVKDEERRERLKLLMKAMHQLTNRQKEIIYLQYFQQLSYEEVSDVMEINYQAARNLLYQAMKSLKKLMSGAVVGFVLMFTFLS